MNNAMNNVRPLQDRIRDLAGREIRPGYWAIEQERGRIKISNAVRTSGRRRVFLWRSGAGKPVRQYYFLESRCRVLSRHEERLTRFLDGPTVKRFCWTVIIAAVIYFGRGIVVRWLNS